MDAPTTARTVEFPVEGMTCAGCARSVERALAAVPGVEAPEVRLQAKKAVVRFDPDRTDPAALRHAVRDAGFTTPDPEAVAPPAAAAGMHRQVFAILGLLAGVVLFVVVAGEGLGLFEAVTAAVPRWLGTLAVLAAAAPIFKDVAKAARRREVTSHTLMSVGAIAALIVGEWPTAAVVVFFMHAGAYTERFTSERARRALKSLSALAPATARIERGGAEVEVPLAQVAPGDIVVVRPGERLPVDGTVLDGAATVDQAAITGESMPVEVEPGGRVFAATHARGGHLRLRADRVGRESTFGRILAQVEAAEANRGDVQRVADRFSAIYLPIVAAIAALTYLASGDALATVAVLVVACSCAFALATPIAMMATIGAAAKQGLLIKGGRHVEMLARCDVLLVDKTGTLTTGTPAVSDVVALGDGDEAQLLRRAAAAERWAEHPLAEAVRAAAAARGLQPATPEDFRTTPGAGVEARLEGRRVVVGSRRVLPAGVAVPAVAAPLEDAGKTLLFVVVDGTLAGLVAARDEVRPEVAAAFDELRALGLGRIELLTGDNPRTARAIAEPLGIAWAAELLPEDKIERVRALQAAGHRVVMVGDGVNDAPALAQADVGIAMGAGTDVALDAAHVALLRDDWRLVPEVFRVARRTMGVVHGNIGFTAAYNLAGLSLAATGYLPPIWAAAAQSLPDLGILANSSRLLRRR
ncbi:MAG: heavy metal translocating P-type ATPase [Alphaproteobacteria bacterium]